ncbi:hypothetical protein LF1_03150 [Rubripirellula obstinata]|uniref:Uncharacterized protein n=1 Tax=Rubripirellula obstinata TaxID=406547 RepID=A0A5B1CCZ0_9BACT|nr:hypothetical protein LF1_03150 [Rubripirellula obstinata]
MRWADENAVGDVIREPVEHCKLQNEHCKLKILGKRYLLVNLHFSVFILQFAINTEAGQPQTPKVVQFPSTQIFSSAQAMRWGPLCGGPGRLRVAAHFMRWAGRLRVAAHFDAVGPAAYASRLTLMRWARPLTRRGSL